MIVGVNCGLFCIFQLHWPWLSVLLQNSSVGVFDREEIHFGTWEASSAKPEGTNQISFASDISCYQLNLKHDRLHTVVIFNIDAFSLFEFYCLIYQRIIFPEWSLFRISLNMFVPEFLFVRGRSALMSGLHCFSGRPSACSCGWNYLVYLAWCPSLASVSYRRRRRRPAQWMCLIWTDGQQTACHVSKKTRVLS